MGAAANGASATNPNLPLAPGAHPLTVRCAVTVTYTQGAATVRTYQLSACDALLDARRKSRCTQAAAADPAPPVRQRALQAAWPRDAAIPRPV